MRSRKIRSYTGRHNESVELLVAIVTIICISAMALYPTAYVDAKQPDPVSKPISIVEVKHGIAPILPLKNAKIVSAPPEPIEESEPSPTLTPIGKLQILGYSPYCSHCCPRADGITASGATATVGRTIAMYSVPFGTEVFIDGLGYYTVEDRGVGKGVIDVVCENHAACYAITGKYECYIVE